MRLLARIRRLKPQDRALLAEAATALALASAAIALQPFRTVVARVCRTPPSPMRADPETAARIGWAVAAVARRAPWRAVCFQQGLAAHNLLRRRGLHSALHYGARRGDDGSLIAHVWVRSGDLDVIGCEDVGDYGLLAVFQA